jgi:hypothetical protein
VKELAGFDFEAQPSIDPKQIRDLAAGRWIANGENVLLLGRPSPIHTAHLATSLKFQFFLPRIGRCRTAQAARLRDMFDLGTLQIARLDHPRRAFAQAAQASSAPRSADEPSMG